MDEQQYHIDYLESKAVLLGLKSLCSGTQNKHIRIQSDNTTTVAYLNAMDGIKSLCVMTWPSKSGNGVLRGTFGLVLPTFLAVLMSRQIKSLGRLTTPRIGHYL